MTMDERVPWLFGQGIYRYWLIKELSLYIYIYIYIYHVYICDKILLQATTKKEHIAFKLMGKKVK